MILFISKISLAKQKTIENYKSKKLKIIKNEYILFFIINTYK